MNHQHEHLSSIPMSPIKPASRNSFGLYEEQPQKATHEPQDGVLPKEFGPLEDLDLFENRFLAKSRYLRKNPELSKLIEHAKITDADEDIQEVAELINISRQIDTPLSSGAVGEIISMASLLKDIRAIEVGGETGVTIAELSLTMMVDSLPDDQLEDYWYSLRFVHSQLIALHESGRTTGNPSWVARRLLTFEHQLGARIRDDYWLEDLPGEPDNREVDRHEVEADNAEIARLFDEAAQYRAYGVKLGYIEQSVRSGSLIFIPNELEMRLHTEIFGDDDDSYVRYCKRMLEPLCRVVDSYSQSHKRLYMNILGKGDSNEGPVVATNLEDNARDAVLIDKHGGLRPEYGGVLAEDMAFAAARHNKYAAFRRFQGEILARYLDLTNPLEIAAKVKEEGGEEQLERLKSSPVDHEPVDIVRDLIIPRIRAARKQEDEQPDVARKENEGEERSVRLHGVVWHIRRLPAGWHASSQAQELAREAGLRLAEGETFVRAHERGSEALGRVVAHRLVSIR